MNKYKIATCFGTGVPSSGGYSEQRSTSSTSTHVELVLLVVTVCTASPYPLHPPSRHSSSHAAILLSSGIRRVMSVCLVPPVMSVCPVPPVNISNMAVKRAARLSDLTLKIILSKPRETTLQTERHKGIWGGVKVQLKAWLRVRAHQKSRVESCRVLMPRVLFSSFGHFKKFSGICRIGTVAPLLATFTLLSRTIKC
jgi:hypothetical protein